MLREISIRDFAIIEQVNITFDNGFHVLTGETGAGKSILFDALSLVTGGRGQPILSGIMPKKPWLKPCLSSGKAIRPGRCCPSWVSAAEDDDLDSGGRSPFQEEYLPNQRANGHLGDAKTSGNPSGGDSRAT